jgi:dTDP-glucose 4,6-dehydratase
LGLKRLKTALIAGGAGFIGSNLVGLLLKKNHKVIVIDNLITGFKKNIEEYSTNQNFSFIEFDITNPELSLKEEKIDIIFHLASPASPPKYFKLPHETIKANTVGTENLLKLAKEKKARFIFASTSEVYGDPLVSPQKESYWGNVNPIGPRSIYDEAKRLGETLCSLYATEGVDVGIVRIFNTYGPNMDPFDGRVVSTFIRQALSNEAFSIQGSGQQTRSFCYVDDLINGIYKFAQADHLGPINLGNPNEMSVSDLAAVISTTLNVEIKFEFLPALIDDPQNRKPDITLATSLIDWMPVIQLEDGIRKTATWIKSII